MTAPSLPPGPIVRARPVRAETWRYRKIRRSLAAIERDLQLRTRWVAATTDDERTWRRAVRVANAYLERKWRQGWLQGARPQQAWFVRCDRTTMTQDDIDSGRLVILVGVAPLRPAEFILLTIRQIARPDDDDD